MITPSLLKAVGAPEAAAALYAPLLEAARQVPGDAQATISSRNGVAMLVAQLAHESGKFQRIEENLNYKAEALIQLFGTGRISQADADRHGRTAEHPANPQAIANLIYGGAWGAKNLGNSQAGDGWLFRGGGLIQLTGRANYTAWGASLGITAEEAARRVRAPEGAAASALWFWRSRKLLGPAAQGDVAGCTRLVNGGALGLEERRHLFEAALEHLAEHSPALV